MKRKPRAPAHRLGAAGKGQSLRYGAIFRSWPVSARCAACAACLIVGQFALIMTELETALGGQA